MAEVERRGNLTRVSTVDALTSDLMERIFAGEFGPRVRLRESVTAIEYGASRHTVRAAMARLQQVGLLTFEPNLGWSIAHLQEEDYEDLRLMRTTIEPVALRLAAESTRAWQPETKSAVVEVLNSKRDEPLPTLLGRDIQLHHQLVAESGSPRLIKAYNEIELELRLWRLQAVGHRQQTSFSEWKALHLELAEAVRVGDVERVLELAHKDAAMRHESASAPATTVWKEEE